MEYGESRNLGKRFRASGKIDANSRRKLAEVLRYTFSLHEKMRTDCSFVPESKINFTNNLRASVKEMIDRNEHE